MEITTLPAEIQLALVPLTRALEAAHLSPSGWEYSDSFGNFLVAFRGPNSEITLTRDRGQFIVGGSDRVSLEEAGLWRAFDTAQELLPYFPSGSVKMTGPNKSFKPNPLRGSA